MGDVVRYKTADNILARGPSPSIWADCPIQEFQENPGKGIHVFDDFRNSIVLKETASASNFTSSIGRVGGDINWYSFVETTELVDLSIPQNDIGVLQFLGDTSDQDVNCSVTGFNVQGIIRTPKVGEQKRFWYEARVKVSTIDTASALGMFIGLAEPGQAANSKGVFAGDAAALDGSADYIGFAILEGDQDDIIVAYNEAGAGSPQSTSGLITPVANTYVRLGIKLVILGISAKIRFFANGVDLGDSVAVDVSATNVNWPGDTDMDLVLSLVTGSGGGSDDALSVDWVRYAQEF